MVPDGQLVSSIVHENSSAWVVPYSGTLSREKTFANFEVLLLFTKVFSMKFGGVTSFGGTIGNESFFTKVFSSKSFQLYDTSMMKRAKVPSKHCLLNYMYTCSFIGWSPHIQIETLIDGGGRPGCGHDVWQSQGRQTRGLVAGCWV